MNKKTARMNKLIEILKVRHLVPVRDLAVLLEVSEMTVRRDLQALEENSMADNVNGTVVYNPAHGVTKSQNEYNLLSENRRQSKEKTEIGKFAASLIDPEDTVILDTGTTTVHIARHIPPEASLTALCYNMNILMELRRLPNVKILFAGGTYHPNTQMFESPQGIDFIRSVRVHKVFVSAAGIHQNLGLTCRNAYEVETKKTILRSGVEKILVADSEKFGAVHSCYFCNLQDIDTIVTDKGLSPQWISLIQSKNIRLHLV